MVRDTLDMDGSMGRDGKGSAEGAAAPGGVTETTRAEMRSRKCCGSVKIYMKTNHKNNKNVGKQIQSETKMNYWLIYITAYTFRHN